MAERKLRAWSEVYQNAYIIGIFACDRTVYEGFKFIAVENANSQKELLQLQVTALQA